MATYVERLQAIGTALVNRAVTPAEFDKLGRAMAYAAGRIPEYEAATSGQRAKFMVLHFLRYATELMSHYDEEQAAAAARAAAAAAIKTGWTDTPE